MTLADSPVTIPHVRINIEDPKGTNRPIFAPIYEMPLLEKLWAGSGKTVTVSAIPAKGPNGRPWPPEMISRVATEAEEEARVKARYERNPSTKEPVFESVYGLGRFHEAFERAVSGAWAPAGARRAAAQAREGVHPATVQKPQAEETPAAEPAPAAEAAQAAEPAPAPGSLTRVSGVGPELEAALVGNGITTIEELAAMPLEELVGYVGVGKRSGKKILDSAYALVMSGMEG